MSEPWEESFLPLNDPRAIAPPVQCDHCLKSVEKPHFAVIHFGRHTRQFAFCDELCNQLFYMARLRGNGL